MEPDRAEQLLAQLAGPDADQRLRAAQALGELKRPDTVPALVERLSDEDPGVAEAAGLALLGMPGRNVAARLAPLLSSQDVGLRNHALSLLRRLGQEAPDLLLDLLVDDDADLRIFAADILADVRAPGVSRALIQALKDPESNVRATAAASLGRRQNSRAVPALVALLEDQEWVAYTAVDALAAIGDTSALPHLIRTMEVGSDLLRSAVAEALGRLCDERAAPFLLDALERAEGPVQRYLLTALVKCFQPQDLAELPAGLRDKAGLALIEALEDTSPQMRGDAIRGLGVLGERAGVYPLLELASREGQGDLAEDIILALTAIGAPAPLIGALEDPRPGVAVAAGRSLGQLGDQRAVPALIKALRHREEAVRAQAAGALGQMAASASAPFLVAALGDGSPLVMQAAAEALGRLGDTSAVPALGALLGHADAEVRHKALEALLALPQPPARKLFTRGLSSSNSLRRRICATGLGRLGGVEDAQALGLLVDDPDPEVRKAVVAALAALPAEAAGVHLGRALADPDPLVRLGLIEALGRRPSSLATQLLVTALDDADPAVCLAAVETLGRVGGASAVEPLLALLHESDAALRVSAARAVGRIGEVGASDALMVLLQDADPGVRGAAVRAIQKIEGGW